MDTITIACEADCPCRASLGRLQELAGLTEAKSRPTPDYDLRAKYLAFNDRLFGGRLPTDLPIEWFASAKVGGVVTYSIDRVGPETHRSLIRLDPRRKYDNARLRPGTMRMRISTVYKRSEQGLDAILIHEMIHVCMVVDGHIGENHGPRFVAMVEKLSKVVGFAIPLEDTVTGLDLADDTIKPIGVLVAVRKDGRESYCIGTEKVMRAKLDAIDAYWKAHSYGVESFTCYVIRDEGWSRLATDLGVSRNFQKLFSFRDTTYQPLIDLLKQDGEVIHRIELPQR